MGFAPGLPTWVLLAVSVINVGIAAIALRRREVRGAVPFAVIMVFVSLYAFGAAVRAASVTLSAYRIGTTIKYAGILALGPTQLWFGLIYTGRNSLLDRRHWALLLVWPVTVFVLVVTAPAHDLLWTVDGFIRGPPLATIERVDTPLVGLTIAYEYALILVTYALIALVGINRGGRYRVQVALMLTGGIVPLAGSMVLLDGGNPAAALDPAAFAYTITGIVFAIALFRFDLLDLVPVARHTLVDEMVDPVFVVNVDGRVVDVNMAGIELLDDEERQVIGRSAADVIPAYGSLKDCNDDSDTDVTIEIDDTLQFFDISRTVLTDRTGTEIGWLFIYRDVTERHIVKERFKRLIERSSDMVAVLDENRTITHVSQSIEEILGYEPDELIGENVAERIHPDDQADIVEGLSENVDEPGYISTYRVRFRNCDGEWRVIEVRARNLLDDPFVEGIVLNSRDVTEKQRQKRKLMRQNERLDQFAGIVSHDLRNPLNVAIGHLDILEADVGDNGSIETIDRQLDRMQDIIDDSLTLARSGEAVTETKSVDLETIGRDAWETVDTGGATFAVTETLQLECDRNRLLNVFENLFRNSVEHNDSADLTVRVGRLDEGHGFYVEDTGTGIPEEKREGVFEQGYTTSRDGTGFGLAIVTDIVQAHGWQISLTDGDDGGARFEIDCDEVLVEKRTQMA
ncbi:PAS domain S-box-containing protein [Halopelagius inordinatus]|uniref:histidine kinase n=1 Tax=Halopelagius inordinatus TaxID=553467 RepID=A0A1I2VRF0_9EURY|nr:histidine kinase N-terminal 7TM domain-containing protein [Halopelagius inordinatus]SFG90056.1 PAS domain S-box-containing protein [Halopelagius inordinatus]